MTFVGDELEFFVIAAAIVVALVAATVQYLRERLGMSHSDGADQTGSENGDTSHSDAPVQTGRESGGKSRSDAPDLTGIAGVGTSRSIAPDQTGRKGGGWSDLPVEERFIIIVFGGFALLLLLGICLINVGLKLGWF